MKLPHFLFLIFLALVVAQPASALNKTVSVANTSTLVLTPGGKVKNIAITNTGAVGSGATIYLSIDGTAATSAAIPIVAGATVVMNYSGAPGSGPNLLYAISATGSVTVNVSTDDTGSGSSQ